MENEANNSLDADFVKNVMNLLNITDFSKINPEWIAVPTYLSRRRSSSSEFIEECGKGTTDIKARKSALFEAVERYSAETARKEKEENLIRGKFVSLKDEYNLMLPRIISNEHVKSVETLELEWCPGYDLLHDEPVLVPADYVFFPYESAFYVPNTVGLAAGETVEDALLHALFEVTEHDTLNIYAYNSIPGKDVRIDGGDDTVSHIYRALTAEGITPSIKFLPNDMHIPVFLVLFETIPHMPGVMTAGMGAHLDSFIAALRALTECAQATCYWYSKMGGQHEKNPKYEFPPLYLNVVYKKTKLSEVTLQDILGTKLNTEDSIKEVVRRMGKFASRVISVDITTDIGIPAVRVVVPECENTFTDHVARGRTKVIQRALISHFGKSDLLPSENPEENDDHNS